MYKITEKEPGEDATADLDLSGIGRQITKARNRKGLTKQEAAYGTGFSAQLLTKLENNENYPSINSLLGVSKALDVPVDVLLQGCHKDFLVFAIEDYLGRLDINEAGTSLAVLEELMRDIVNE